MTAISSDFGGTRGRPRHALIESVLRRTLQRHPELNYSGLASLLGWPPESFQNYRDAKTSPTLDRVAVTLARQTAPGDFVLDLLQSLAGRRAIVCLVDNQDVPAGTQPADVVRKLIQTLAGFDALLQDAYERCGDGVVSADDAAAIAKRWAEVRGLGEQMVRFSQHCAAQAARR